MGLVKTTFFLPLRDNDNRDLSREIGEVEDEGCNRSSAPSIYAAIAHSTSSVRSVCGYKRSFSFSMRNA